MRRRTKFSRSGNRSFLLIEQRMEQPYRRRSQIVLSSSGSRKVPPDVTDEMIRSCLDTLFTDAFHKERLKTILDKFCSKGFSSTLSISKHNFSCKIGYRLSDASNARNLVTSMPYVNQLRNVDTAVKTI